MKTGALALLEQEEIVALSGTIYSNRLIYIWCSGAVVSYQPVCAQPIIIANYINV